MRDIKSASRGSYEYAEIPVGVREENVRDTRAAYSSPLLAGKRTLRVSRLRTVLAVVGGILMLLVIFVISLTVFERNFMVSLGKSFAQFQETLTDSGFAYPRPDDARFDSLKTRIEALKKEQGNSLVARGLPLLQSFVPLAQESVEALSHVESFTGGMFELARTSDAFQKGITGYLFERKGEELIAHLREFKDLVSRVENDHETLASIFGTLRNASALDLPAMFPLSVDAKRLVSFLNAAITLLASDEERHLVVILGNTAELRPGGGFIGSYVDVVVKRGNVERITVHDINDADRVIHTFTVPPRPLQLIVRNWRAADANWFFDFPESARTFLSMLESSALYTKPKVSFDGVLALTPRVVEDMLQVIGAVKIPEYDLTLDHKNVLREVQRVVQEGQAKKSGASKDILSAATTAVLQRMSLLTDEEKKKINQQIFEWVRTKDIVVYAKPDGIQSFLEFQSVAGAAFKPENGFRGDYLGIARASIGAEKSDLMMQEKLVFESSVGADGVVKNAISIERTHGAEKKDPWWYRAPNQTYVQVIAPPGAELTWSEGGMAKRIEPRAEYTNGIYVRNPQLAAIENTRKTNEEFPYVEQFDADGTRIFATWMRVGVGETKKTVIEYTHRLHAPLAEGDTYRFVFDKQPGAKSSYQFLISAPPGFIWQEANGPLMKYISDDPDGRVVLDLTPVKD